MLKWIITIRRGQKIFKNKEKEYLKEHVNELSAYSKKENH
jgi:hypothetical protein